jgi:hypothetical protein
LERRIHLIFYSTGAARLGSEAGNDKKIPHLSVRQLNISLISSNVGHFTYAAFVSLPLMVSPDFIYWLKCQMSLK